jgi:hypothetical protein
MFQWIIRFVISSGFALSSLLLNWLLLGDTSPLHHYFLWHGGLPNLWGFLNIIPAIVSAVVAGNPHSLSETVYLLALFAQWFLFGFLFSSALVAMNVFKS